jgi:2-polyprenyl-6-methoxyphenol hydroxylase-like FAD-dependent oxidoreductase
VFFEEMAALPVDTIYWIVNPSLGQAALIAPQGQGRVRAYVVYPHDASHRLQGTADIPHFIEESVKAGAPREFYAGAREAGPLASFEGADTWVPHPYRTGVVLIGDAASSNDPSFGQGLSLTVRDVRTLRDQLLSHEDWNTAGHAYAEEHDRYYGTLHRVTEWIGQMLYEPGPEAEARRARALPLIAQEGTRVPDHLFSGLELPADETVRRRFFGEE